MNFIKRLMPSSLVAQMILVVLLALLVAQAISFIILGSAYRTAFSDVNKQARLQQMESLVALLEISPVEDYQTILNAVRSREERFSVTEESILTLEGMGVSERRIMNKLEETLDAEYQGRIRVALVRAVPEEADECNDTGQCYFPKQYDAKHNVHGRRDMPMRNFRREPLLVSLIISVKMDNNLWVNLRASSPAPPPLAPRQTVVFLITSIVLVLLALAFMVRKITRPMRMLAGASHRLGVGEQVDPLPEEGPSDVKETIHAFNKMNQRLQRFVSDRTRMLAALSHDLRTPITTMRLRVEMMPESTDRNHLLATLEDMHQMSEATLAFMRQASDNEKTRKVDMNAMLESLCDDYLDMGKEVHYEEVEETVVSCRPASIRRALRNLIDNALKYGEVADIRLQVSGDNIFIIIKDKGPGIPEDQMEKVFEPFFRIEGSRNRDTGGIGLGMSIARNIIRNHGGDMYLENTDSGLKVKVVLSMT